MCSVTRILFSEAATGGVLQKKVFLERDSGAGVFMQNFQEHLFHRAPLGGCFWILTLSNPSQRRT